MDVTVTLLTASAVVLLAIGASIAVRRYRTAERTAEALASFEPGSELLAASVAGEASIVTEFLTDSQVGELIHNAIPMDPLSELATQMTTVAGPAVQATFSSTAAVAHRGRYLVEFTSEGSSALASKGVSMLHRVDGRLQPTLVSAASKIEENATLVGKGSRVAVNAAAVAHVVVLLAVQAQLVSMERTLERMEGKLDALRRFNDDKEIARVRGWLRKLAAVRDEMSKAQTDADVQRWLAILEDADAAFLQVDELAKRQCDDATLKSERTNLDVTKTTPLSGVDRDAGSGR